MATLKVTIYSPIMTSLPEETPKERATRIIEAMRLASAGGAQVFLGPEYFFSHNSSSLATHNKSIIYSSDDADEARSMLVAASALYRGMLIIPGTFFMLEGAYDPHAFNTAFVYLNGSKLTECSKHDKDTDAVYAELAGVPFYPGDKAAYFEFLKLNFCLQICSDATNSPTKKCDLSIVPSFKPGSAAISNITQFRYRILSDGGPGSSSIIYSKGFGAGRDTFSGTVHDYDLNL